MDVTTRRLGSLAMAGLLVAPLGGCIDVPTEPLPNDRTIEVPLALTSDEPAPALTDALERLLPSVANQALVAEIRSALVDVVRASQSASAARSAARARQLLLSAESELHPATLGALRLQIALARSAGPAAMDKK